MMRMRIHKDEDARSCFTCIEVASYQGIELRQRVFDIKDFLVKREGFGLDIEGELGKGDEIGGGWEILG